VCVCVCVCMCVCVCVCVCRSSRLPPNEHRSLKMINGSLTVKADDVCVRVLCVRQCVHVCCVCVSVCMCIVCA